MIFDKKFPYGLFVLLFFQFLFFFTVLLGNQNVREEAINYYFDSGLHQTEFPAYARFLQKNMANNIYFKRIEDFTSEKLKIEQIYWLVFFDPFFQKELESGKIFKKTPFYNDWRKKREVYKDFLDKDHLLKTMFNSYHPKPINILFSFFSTENYLQFFANCFFLLIVGLFLENKIGSILFIESFILGGILMLSSYCLIAPYSLIPLAASNGGVASLIGLMVCFLFSRHEMTLSSVIALVILPAWLLIQYLFYTLFDIHLINVVTQIPALIGGGAIGIYLRHVSADSGELGLLAKTRKDPV